jgi:DNA-directed RNA polymerase specialized sigma24 family protein
MAPPTNRFSVKTGLTPNRRTRRRRQVENSDYAAFAHRVVKAHARRVAHGDIESLTELTELAGQLDQAITEAITGLRAHGYSWADIATGLGVSRQAAQQRWGKTA